MWRFIFFIILVLLHYSMMVETSAVKKLSCGDDEITVHSSNGTQCILCKKCFPGREPSISCGVVLEVKSSVTIRCRRCPKGRYSDSESQFGCKKCTRCRAREQVIRKCSRHSDTICHTCMEGFYASKETFSCLPCTPCCGDDQDVKTAECITQEAHCSFDSYRRCPKVIDLTNQTDDSLKFHSRQNKTMEIILTYIAISKVINHTRNNNQLESVSNYRSKSFIFIISTGILAVSIIVLVCVIIKLFLCKNRNIKAKRYFCISRHAVSKHKSTTDTSSCEQSDELEDWAVVDDISCTYFFKCGVAVHYDKTSRVDGTKVFVVETANSCLESYLTLLEPNQIFISSMYKFYSQGTQFEKPVQVTLPHSAFIDASNKNWDIKILYIDGREQKKVKLKTVQSEVVIEWNEVKFFTSTLLSYVVVGRPLQLAKKRMQLVVFSMQNMISDRLEMVLYLLDDSIASLQRIKKENKAKGWAMISSLYAVFIDCFNAVHISVDVEGLIEPWTLLHVQPKAISSKLLVDSYFSIPAFHAKFRRSKRSAQHFGCDFHVDIGGRKTIIPALTFVPEEMFCFFVDVHNEDPSVFDKQVLLGDIPYDINYEMCRKLDIPAKDLGKWRDVGRHYGLSEAQIEVCRGEYAFLDGSPSMKLMEIICCEQPKLTVGEFAKLLKDLGRRDVVAVLSKLPFSKIITV